MDIEDQLFNKIDSMETELEEVEKERDALKRFTVLAGRYDACCVDDKNPSGENVKYINEFKDLSEAMETASNLACINGFVYIEHMGQRAKVA